VDAVIKKVDKTGGIVYATEKMQMYRNKALEVLNSFPANEMTRSLEQLVHFTIERTK
jgi:octaprenyl-diphosphate synthase